MIVFAQCTRGWTFAWWENRQTGRICPVYTGMNLSISGTLDKDMASAPYTRGWTHFLITSGLIINDRPRIHGNEFATPQLPKYVSFLANIDQKALSAKYARPKWYILVLLRKFKTKKRLANHRNPLEEFSICPVYTGMSPREKTYTFQTDHLPRIHGDEPFPDGFVVGVDAFEPRVHGDEPCV